MRDLIILISILSLSCFQTLKLRAQGDRYDSLLNHKKILLSQKVSQDSLSLLDLEISKELYFSGSLKEAYGIANMVVQKLQDSQNLNLKAKAYVYRANYLLENAEYAEALSDFEYAYKLYQVVENRKRESVVLGNIAVVFEKMKNYDLALEYNLRALKIKKELGNPADIANTYTNTGNIYVDLQKYELALGYYNKAIQIDSTAGNLRNLSADFNNFGILYSKIGDLPQALSYYEQTLEIDRQLGDLYGQTIALNNMAEGLKEIGKYEEAIEHAERSLKLATEIGSTDYIAKNHKQLSEVYDELGDYESALKHHKKFTAVSSKITEDEEFDQILKLHSKLSAKNSTNLLSKSQSADMPDVEERNNYSLWLLLILLPASVLLGIWIYRNYSD